MRYMRYMRYMRSTRTKSLQNEVLLVPQLYQLTNYNKLTRLRKNEMLHAHNSISATLMRDYELAQASDPGRRCSDYVETMYTGNLVLSSILNLLWERIAHSIATSTFTFQGFSKAMKIQLSVAWRLRAHLFTSMRTGP